MTAVERELVDADAGLLRLLNPPFARSTPNPGYSGPIHPECARTADSTRRRRSGH